MSLYFRLISIRIRAQMQYRLSFVLDTVGAGFAIFIEFITLVFVFARFGSIGGWTLGEVAFLYGLSESAFGAMDMIFSGFDPGYFAQQVQRGTFDQFLLRPLGLPLQMFTAEFVVRRVGRIINGLLIFAFSLSQTPIIWTPDKLLYLPLVWISTVAFFGGLFVVGATLCFWTVESIEVINIFTYGGTTMMSYPMHIYEDWLRRFFLFIVPAGFMVYYPALYFLGKPDPLGLPSFAPFLAPLAGFGTLAVAFAVWNIGVRKYASTGT
ncbi:MAG: ABC-2 family transporter protein [Chloroflexota bacterium]